VEREEQRDGWYERFLWALRQGCAARRPRDLEMPGLGAQAGNLDDQLHGLGTIRDSMDDILGKVHEAGLTLKAGCGIGYEFSTLRPRGAYVSGAGAYTSGPLSFMDIYDKDVFHDLLGRRPSRRGKWEPSDIGHPDAMDFIRAKR